MACYNDQCGGVQRFLCPKRDRPVEITIRITALEDSLFIGGSEDVKSYGGFSIRLDPGEGLSFKNASGGVEAQNTAVDAGPWMNIIGDWSNEIEEEGVIMISRPENPNQPQPWIIRTERSMQNAMYPGLSPVMIPMYQPLHLKYRVIIYYPVPVSPAPLSFRLCSFFPYPG